MEEVTMKHPHFRLKVDLSKFFQDVRKFCWVFIDQRNIKQIIHMKQHISKLFNISEPFHLLLNNEYLPPIEDVRILKENETILVVPGSGIHNNNEVPSVEISNNSVYESGSNNIQVQTTNIKTGIVACDTSNYTLNSTQLGTQPSPINNLDNTKDMTYYSIINDTSVNYSREDTDSKTTDNDLIEDCNMTDSMISVPKRKRVRKRKPRNRSRFIESLSTIENTQENIPKEAKLKKPKIIDSCIIPSGKHIRFNNVENDENNIAKQIVQEVSRNESYLSDPSTSKKLTTLLALGQSSTPKTFMSKKLKTETKTDSMLSDEIRRKILNKIVDDKNKDLCNKESKVQSIIQTYKNLYTDIEKIPIMTRSPLVNDIIAFKTLKIGADHTPEMSKFIFTRIEDVCAESGNYTLQILDGKEEIQFSLSVSENDSENQSNENTFVLFNHSHMTDLRLIA